MLFKYLIYDLGIRIDGVQEADSIIEAEQIVRNVYALELDCCEEDIELTLEPLR